MPFKIMTERMKLPAGNIHIRRISSLVQLAELNAQLICMFRLNASFTSGQKEFLNTCMAETLNHP